MNRLIIIGNGFDLAHGLPTSYRNFIDDFWKDFKDKCKGDFYKELVSTHDAYDGYYTGYKQIENYNDFKSNLKEYCKDYGYNFYDNNCTAISNFIDVFRFKSDFFYLINQKNSENWVDIENEYYRLLKEIVKSEGYDKKVAVKKLNDEFEQVKSLLEIYLKDKVLNVYNSSLQANNRIEYNKFINLLKPITLKEIDIQNEFSSEDFDEMSKIFNEQFETGIKNTSLYVLTFNYTSTFERYVNNINESRDKVGTNYIHGFIGNDNNYKINFGFGDEMDDDYKIIENLDDNEYLKNFKSFQYLQNQNYKHLLDFIDREKFQIYIMGHSCGLSDRTLLNTVFEHNNCRSIKVFYYKNGDYDNYTEIIQNISRHFNKKALMRSKIVNKTFCEPMPQIQLPKK
jgi:Bacteriophage abortive infection AbiH